MRSSPQVPGGALSAAFVGRWPTAGVRESCTGAGRVGPSAGSLASLYKRTLRSRRLLSTTLTLLIAIAALAMIGESNHPVNG